MSLYTNPDKLVKSLIAFNDPIYEAGGIIFSKDIEHTYDQEYTFLYLDNKFHGTNTGRALYEPEDKDYAEKSLPLVQLGWRAWGSFHTHPQFYPQYSMIDYDNLFQGYKYNYIKSVKYDSLVKWEWINEKELKGTYVF